MSALKRGVQGENADDMLGVLIIDVSRRERPLVVDKRSETSVSWESRALDDREDESTSESSLSDSESLELSELSPNKARIREITWGPLLESELLLWLESLSES